MVLPTAFPPVMNVFIKLGKENFVSSNVDGFFIGLKHEMREKLERVVQQLEK